jgi:hypothetical protein
MGDHFSGPPSGAHYGRPSSDLRVRWARARPHRAVAGAWLAVVVHLVVLATLLAVSGPQDFWPVYAWFGAASALTFVWLCACWRVEPDETTWDQGVPPEPHRPPGVVAGLRAGWGPLLAWLVGTAAVWGGLRGLEGLIIGGLLAAFLLPMAIAAGTLPWVLVVMPARYAAAGVGRLRGEAGTTEPQATYPSSYPSSYPGPAQSSGAPHRSSPSAPQPNLGVALLAYGVLALMVLPTGLSLLLSGAATSRYDAIPALLGFGGVEPTSPVLLWVARAGFAAIVLVGVLLWRWLARERRRIEHRERGFGEL